MERRAISANTWSTNTASTNPTSGYTAFQTVFPGWMKLGFVPGRGTSNVRHEYLFEDKGLSPGRYAYRLKQTDNDGAFKYSSETEAVIGAVAKEFRLIGAYPNPFNPASQIRFSFANDGFAALKVYNIIGQLVATLFEGQASAGMVYERTFNAALMSSGIYFARLESAGQVKVQKLVCGK